MQIPVAEAPGSSAVTVEPTQSVLRQVEKPFPQPERSSPDGDAGEALPSAASLADLVERTPLPATLSSDMECLAGAIYFEARSETLAGQLAVGRVIVTRAASGRFPSSYCGVVYQPAQFSFMRANGMPAVNHDSNLWQQAVKIALIADSGAWKSPVEGAMFFHATHVAPSWGKIRMARVDNHIFYR